MVTPAGFEPAIAGLRTRSPGPLDEGATSAGRRFYACINHLPSTWFLCRRHKGQSAPTAITLWNSKNHTTTEMNKQLTKRMGV